MAIDDYFEPDIIIQRNTSTKKVSGKMLDAWATHLTVDGRIRPLTGKERLAADKVTLYATHRLYTFVADIAESDRVSDSGNIYEIKFVHNPMNFDRFLQVDLELMR